MARTHSLKTVQKIPITVTEAWDFFSRPENLSRITPSHLDFRIMSEHHGASMYPGQIIEYKVRPLLGIPLYWMTEITHVADEQFFVDEQRFGPYALWHHQHHFKAIAGGTEMTDIVHYRLPLGWLGDLAHAFMVKEQVRGIFEYRFQAVSQLFGEWPGQSPRLELR